MFEPINHQTESIKKFLYQFRDKEKIHTLSNIISSQLNEIEKALEYLSNKFSLELAEGKQLDIIGLYKNLLRLGKSDNEYRQAIKNQIVLDSSDGTPQAVINSSKIILSGTFYQYSESYPARCEVVFINSTCSIDQYNVLKNSVPLGVSLGIRTCPYENTFGFKGNTINQGFGSVNDRSIGGHFGTIIGEV